MARADGLSNFASSSFIVLGHLFFRHAGSAEGLVLDKILRERKIERPIKGHAHLFFHTRKLAQVYAAPQPPSDEPGEVDAKDVGHSRTASDRSQLADGCKRELLYCAASLG